MGNFNLAPNEFVILKEARVAHGSVGTYCTDELILTNLNIICINKGVFGNTKRVFTYPLNQIKRYNGKPQVIMGKLFNGLADLEIYMMNGLEQFCFQVQNKETINTWIREINRIIVGDSGEESPQSDDGYDSNTLVGAFKEVGSQFKEVGDQFKEALGFKTTPKPKPPITTPTKVMINKKCISCSAPLIGYKGQVVHCKYCDTEQTL